MTTGKALNGKPYAGNPHARFEEGASAPETPRRNALLHNMKKLIAAAVIAVTCASPSFAEKPYDGETRIVSYNVRHCRGADNKVDAAMTAGAIKSVEMPEDPVCRECAHMAWFWTA